ncbi:MAG: glycosyltransferase family 4 protein [Ignavibacteria bacterium]
MIKKKVLLIGSLPPPYHGSNIFFDNLLNSKLKNEFDLLHLDTSDHRNLDNLTKLDFTNVYLALKNIFQLARLLRKEKPDIVYITPAVSFLPYFRDGLFLLTSSYLSKAGIIIHLHGGKYFRDEFYNKSNIFAKSFIRSSLKKVDRAVVLSDSIRPVFDGLVNKISVIPNGTDFGMNFSETDLKKDTGIIKISYLGNLFEDKGVLDVMNSVKSIVEKNKNKSINVEFGFAGDWSEKEKKTKSACIQIIKENNLDKYVKFYGVLLGKEKEKFLLETEIFVFPSRNEGSPLVILEAMSAACPVISTKGVGAIPDMVLDGVTGILIESKNVEQISGAILKLIEDRELRSKMGTAGRERFRNYFTLEKNISGLSDLFKESN